MRGLALSSLGMAIITITAMFIAVTVKNMLMVFPAYTTYTDARVAAGYGFIEWEIKGNAVSPGQGYPTQKCIPALVLDLNNDPVEEFTKPYVIYFCEVG